MTGRNGWYIDKIRLFLTNGQSSPEFGVHGGTGYDFALQSGETVTSAIFKSGWWLDSVTLKTSKGRSFKIGGDRGYDTKTINIPEGARIIGLYGTTDPHLKSLGFIISTD